MQIIPSHTNYSITTDGQVFSHKVNRFLKAKENGGYMQVNIDGKYHYVHRLVALVYLPDPDNLPEVNHIDEDKSNNDISNLEWCTRQRNAEHSLAKQWLVTTPKGEQLNVSNLAKFCREHDLNRKHMSAVSQGKRHHHKGFKVINLPIR